jgi:uncharacterized membrane protein
VYQIIGWDGKQYGPVSAEDLRAWLAGQRVNAETQVCPVGGTEWKPLSAYPELVGRAAATAIAPAPIAAQNLEGIALDDSRSFTIGACVSRGWDAVRGNFLLSIGATFVVMLVSCVLSAVPLIGGPINLVLQGILYGGLYWFFLKLLRGEPAELGDAFAGFKRNTKDLILAGVVQGAIVVGVVLVAVVPMIALGVGFGATHKSPTGLLFVLMPLALLLGVGVMVLSTMWVFAFPLVIDKGLGFWQAMELSRKTVLRRFWSVLGLLIVCGLIAVAGCLALIIGIFVAMPICVAAMAAAYDELFGETAASPA